MRIAIGIATLGRAAILGDVLNDITRQTRAPDKIVVCHTGPADIEGVQQACAEFSSITFIVSAPGLPRQRNAILDQADDADIILFIDDDFIMVPDYVAVVEAILRGNPDLVAVTGTLIHDDVKGPGLSFAAGRAMIEADITRRGPAELDLGWHPAPHGYGCNMALRLSTIREQGLRFDERLPLYGWSEDIDFTHRIARFGRIGKLAGARGVHLGVKQGRSSGRRLGYSQVANPLYLLRKGSYSTGRAGRSVARNLAANAARALWPEPYIDRRGRLWGNMLAFLDLLRGRMRPERVLDI